MATDLISGSKGFDAFEPELDSDDELPDGAALGLTTVELALTPDVPAVLVAVEENV
jgi:hypothetical protein